MECPVSLHRFCDLLVVVVTSKKSLNGGSLQRDLLFLHLGTVGVFPILVCVNRVKIVFLSRRVERGPYLFVVQRLPVVPIEPAVLLDLVWAVVTQPVRGLPLNQFIDKVGSFA